MVVADTAEVSVDMAEQVAADIAEKAAGDTAVALGTDVVGTAIVAKVAGMGDLGKGAFRKLLGELDSNYYGVDESVVVVWAYSAIVLARRDPFLAGERAPPAVEGFVAAE